MSNTCSRVAAKSALRLTPAAIALASMLAFSSLAQAATIGHSRLVSAPGQPLSIVVPLRDLSTADQQALRVEAAPLSAWKQAALIPPVDIATMQFSIEPGFTADSRVVQVRSNQPFNGAVADLLLQVNTAAGSRQYQVSLLSQADPAGRVASATATSAAPSQVTAGAARDSRSGANIVVKRGDTMFALARAHAVEGVTVYQMMVALQKANPQAFIEGNINLVKAGATLGIPDAAALRAVSDREARRIFQQQLHAFAAYRDRIAGRQGQAVQSGSAQQGSVTGQAAQTAAAPAATMGDQVVLSSAQAADAAQDQQSATQSNIQESQARVSQLERNVQSLSQALQMQGEAAKEAALEGAAAVGQGLTEAAGSLGLTDDTSDTGAASSSAAQSEGTAQDAGASTAQGTEAAAGTSSASSDTAAGAGDQGAANGAADASVKGQSDTAASDTADASVNGQSDTAASDTTAASVSGQNDSAASDAAAGQSAAASDASAANGEGSTVSTGTAPSGSDGTAPSGSNGASSAQASSAGSASGAASISTQSDPAVQAGGVESDSNKAEQPVSWFQDNLLGIITGILAIVVLIIAWLLRRASASRSESGQGVVTEAMVQERLESIDLDFDAPPADQRPTRSS